MNEGLTRSLGLSGGNRALLRVSRHSILLESTIAALARRHVELAVRAEPDAPAVVDGTRIPVRIADGTVSDAPSNRIAATQLPHGGRAPCASCFTAAPSLLWLSAMPLGAGTFR
jgi:hypothetical protein